VAAECRHARRNIGGHAIDDYIVYFMKTYQPSEIRNFAIVGHASAGKTMLSEAMLVCGGVLNRLGSIAAGTTASDYHDSERQRQISVHASLLHTEWQGKKFNIIDTPGYLDFISEGLGALRVGDFALVVVHAQHGVSVGTEQVWEYASRYGIPKMIVINALDARGLFVEGPSRPPDVAAMEGRLSLATFLWDNTTRREKQQAEESSMENFAMATGGLLFRNNNDLDYGFYELGVVPAFSYMLSFSADDVRPDGALHALKVKVDRPNSYAEYRPGYYAPTTAAAGATESVPVKSKLDQAVTSQQNFSEIPATFVPKNAKSPDGKSELAVTIHVDLKSMPFKTENGREVERLDMVVALFDSAGNFVTGKSGEMDLALKSGTFVRLEATGVSGVLSLQAPPGSYRLRGVVQEAVSGKTAATSMAAEVQ